MFSQLFTITDSLEANTLPSVVISNITTTFTDTTPTEASKFF
jgi:hypothetical protein